MSPAELEQMIRERAYLIWEKEGSSGDRASYYWSMAVASVKAELAQQGIEVDDEELDIAKSEGLRKEEQADEE